jgi:hypothetical protein
VLGSEALLSARPQRLTDVLVQASRTLAAAVLLVGLCLAQQDPAQPSFHAQTDLVTVPFQVRRGSRSASDLKPSDVVLLEDGVPRGFTIFEAPLVHLTLDLVVMFDVTNPKAGQKGRAGFWDAKALQALASYWSETITRRLFDENRATIRFSIYRFDQSRLQRLCQSTSDPKVLSDALHRLAGTAGQAAGQDVDIPLPAGLAVRDMERKWQAEGNLPQPWSLAGALSVLRDSAITVPPGPDKETAARALVIFSTGAEGTSITPEDLADQAVSAGVPIYPVALPDFPWVLPYEGYTYRGPVKGGFYAFGGLTDDVGGGNKHSMFGPGGAYYCPKCGAYVASYINYPFELLGDLTGALNFEAVNHFVIPPDADIQGFVLALPPGADSMTGGETDDILERIKKHALARFSSNYTVGFVPSPSGAPREHKLEVKLAPKSSGKVTEGKRSAVY